MKRKRMIFFASIAIGILFISGCALMEDDVQFTRRIFNGLCSGNIGVANSIDWTTLVAMDVDVGKAYTVLSQQNKADYKKAFFYNFSFAFRASGGKASAFFNWRVNSKDADKTIIACDTASKVILFSITTKGGKRKLTAINFQQ